MAVILGKKYRDKTHGTEGIATARTEYMTGCARVLVERVLDGKVMERWIDEINLEGVELSPEEVKLGGPGAVAPSCDPA